MGASNSTLVAETAPKAEEGSYSVYDPAHGPFWTSDGTAEVNIPFARNGAGSDEEKSGGIPVRTISEVFAAAAEKCGQKTALRVERPCPPFKDGKADLVPPEDWQAMTWQGYYDESRFAAKALLKHGMAQHDTVNIFGFNSPEWFVGQMGGILAGGKAAGIYPTDTAEQLAFKVHHSGGFAMFLEGNGELKKVSQVINDCPKIKLIVIWAGEVPEGGKITRDDGSEVVVYSYGDFIKLGQEEDDAVLAERTALIKPGHCACLIYTSGTTGNPKAVMISHDNILFISMNVMRTTPGLGDRDEEMRVLSFLPLSHVAGAMVDIISPIVISAYGKGWSTVSFARPYDLKVGTLGDRLRSVRPTLFLGVPRVWEKVAEKLKAIGAKTTGVKKKVSTWAKGKGLEYQKNMQLGGSGAKPFMYAKADKIVLSKIKEALGLDACTFGMTGAAPISKDTLEYFGSLGIQINEVYGMSESTGATTWSLDNCHEWGSCGWEMAGIEVKVFKVDEQDLNKKEQCPPCDDLFGDVPEECQGELCYRGRHIMMGYLANPELGPEHVEEINKKNAGAIDDEGWLHSGDKGCQSKRGMLRITGRYKELIIGAGGENIAPVPIEDNVKKYCPAISNIMMVGDKRKFNVALVTLKAEGATGEYPGGDDLAGAAKAVDPNITTVSGAIASDTYFECIKSAILQTNREVPNNASKIQRFTILPRDFSSETGELTPTLKLKRSVAEKKFLAMIDKIYAVDDPKAAYVRFEE